MVDTRDPCEALITSSGMIRTFTSHQKLEPKTLRLGPRGAQFPFFFLVRSSLNCAFAVTTRYCICKIQVCLSASSLRALFALVICTFRFGSWKQRPGDWELR